MEYTQSALAAIISGTISGATALIEPVPQVHGISVPFILSLILLIAGIISFILEIIIDLDGHGYIIGAILIIFTGIIDFGSPQLIAQLMIYFVIIDIIIAILAFFEPLKDFLSSIVDTITR